MTCWCQFPYMFISIPYSLHVHVIRFIPHSLHVHVIHTTFLTCSCYPYHIPYMFMLSIPHSLYVHVIPHPLHIHVMKVLYVLFYCTLSVFNKSHPSERFSDGDRSLFTPDSRRELNAISCKLYTSK